MSELSNFLPLFGILALLFVFYKHAWVAKQDPGNEKMQFIASNIQKGAMAFLRAEYKILSIFVVAVSVLLYFKGSMELSNSNIPGHPMIALSFMVCKSGCQYRWQGRTINNITHRQLYCAVIYAVDEITVYNNLNFTG